MDVIGRGMSPGAFLCDMFPIREYFIQSSGLKMTTFLVKYSPSWVPFQRRIAEAKKVIDRTVYQPYEDVKKLVVQGMAPPSLAKELLMSGNDEPRFQNRATWAVSSMYGGALPWPC